MIQRSMAPVWEANHVWLIFVLVIVWTAFPVRRGPLLAVALGSLVVGLALMLPFEATIAGSWACSPSSCSSSRASS
jgi:cytochrome d ubiquinol oxidase subunit II